MIAKSNAENLATGRSGNNFVANSHVLIHVIQRFYPLQQPLLAGNRTSHTVSKTFM